MYAAVPVSGSGQRWSGPLGVAFTDAGKRALRPICVRDETKELKIVRNAFRPVPRREHVVREMEFIVFPAVVLDQENLNRKPRAFIVLVWAPVVGSTNWMLWLTV